MEPEKFTCKARAGFTDPPQECDWPFCGCDTYADKVLEACMESDHFEYKKGIEAVKRLRCFAHIGVPQITSTNIGEECGECVRLAAVANHAELVAALTKLTNEAQGFVGMADYCIRNRMGNTMLCQVKITERGERRHTGSARDYVHRQCKNTATTGGLCSRHKKMESEGYLLLYIKGKHHD